MNDVSRSGSQLSEAAKGDPSLRDLPPRGWPRSRALLARAVRRHCPQCGGSGIFSSWLTIKDRCPRCDYEFAREGGYFLGGYAVNLIAAEVITVGLLVVFLIWTNYTWVTLEFIFVPMAVALPLLFFPYARMLWMAFDLSFTPENQI